MRKNTSGSDRRGVSGAGAGRLHPVSEWDWRSIVVATVFPLALVVAASFPGLTAATLAGMVVGAVGPRVVRRNSGTSRRGIRTRISSTDSA